MEFVHTGFANRVVFGAGRRRDLGAELDRLKVRSIMVVATPGRWDVAERLASESGRTAFVHAEARMHTPLAVTETALKALKRRKADGIVAIGGGSAIGLGKALAVRAELPLLALPTTYSGSEVTPVLGESGGNGKVTRRTPRALPATVIYDPELTAMMPAAVAGPSGLNAMAHAIEALYDGEASPLITMAASTAIGAIGEALPAVVETPTQAAAQIWVLHGAWLAGTCLAATQMALQHKLAHVLGGLFDLPHAEVHAVLLPHTTAFNAPAAPDAMARIARTLGAQDAVEAIAALVRKVAPRTALAEFGLTAADLDQAAEVAMEQPYPNPRPVTREAIRELLEAAFAMRQAA